MFTYFIMNSIYPGVYQVSEKAELSKNMVASI